MRVTRTRTIDRVTFSPAVSFFRWWTPKTTRTWTTFTPRPTWSCGFGLFATAARLWEWDFWAIWGLKARLFLGHGGIDWRFLESPWNTYVHPDYPLLVPFNFDFVALLNGGWSDRWLGLLSVGWAAA